MQTDNLPTVVVVGPTGAGKSELGIQIAERFSGEIVNCDSIQVYEGLWIGAAKTPVSERRGIPHHLLDFVSLGEDLTAGAYARVARPTIDQIHARGNLPVIVGGTGFYLRALLDGLSPAPTRDARLRERLASLALRRPAALHRFLHRYDAVAAARIHLNDRPKLMRAIEITILSCRPASELSSIPPANLPKMRVLKIGLDPHRALLRRTLARRTARMFECGLLEEVKGLLESGVSPENKALQSIGYKQAVQVLQGWLPLSEAISQAQIKTNQYAKRQMTWFRKDAGIRWIPAFGSETSSQEQAVEWVKEFLRHPASLPH